MKKMHLSIPQPCHEDWNEMTPNERGRFCQSCQKTVVNFTAMSDVEVLNFFKRKAGKVCGQFRQEQVDKTYSPPQTQWTPQWVKAGLLASGLLTAAGLDAQHTVAKEKMVVPANVKQEKMIIRGMVTDESGEPLIGASVNFIDTDFGTVADFDGKYELKIPTELANTSTWKIDFKYTGYAPKRIQVDRAQQVDYQLDVVLEEAASDEVVVYAHSVRTLRGAVAVIDNSTIQQEIIIKGKVTDEEDEPLIGATVLVVGGEHGTVADFDGNYELKIPENIWLNANTKIEYSYTGYFSKIVALEQFASQQKDMVLTIDPRFDYNDYHNSLVLGFSMVKVIEQDDTTSVNWWDSIKSKLSKKKKVTSKVTHPTALYPNPFTDYLQVNYQSTQAKTIDLTIVDVSGKVMFEQSERVVVGENTIQLTPNLIDGNYWLRIESAGEEAEVLTISRITKN